MIIGAKLIGFKEGLKIGIIWLVFYSYLLRNDKRSLIRPFYLGLLFVFLSSVCSFFLLPKGISVRDYLGNLISMSFALFLILSVSALFHESGINLLGPLQRFSFSATLKRLIEGLVVFLLTLLFFLPDSIGSLFFLRELSFMKESTLVYLYAFIGFSISILVLYLIVKLYKPYQWLGNFFDVPQLLLFLAMVKLLGSGIKDIAELSLIPSVQRGFMKFTHDVIHQTFVLLMVPDHPLLKTTVWNFIGIFFGSNFASFVSLFMLLFFPLLFLYHRLFKPLPEPKASTSVEKRKIKSSLLSERRRKALPVIFFIGFILIAWFSQTEESVSQLYKPRPRPVVVDRGVVLIPMKDPTMDLMDGSLHKFSLVHEGEEIRILVVKRPDGRLSVCLDACENCPPEGYAQRGSHVICIYCNTPIPVQTLGEAGGCNPIPLRAVIDERYIRIELSEILRKWGFVGK
jgi:uncharacterized membrane protein